MRNIKFENKDIELKYNTLMDDYYHLLNEWQKHIIELVLIWYKAHYKDEEYFPTILIYWYLFFKIIDINNPLINKKDINAISLLKCSYEREIKWDYEWFLNVVFDMNEELFKIKIIIKYNLLLFKDKFEAFFPYPENYYKSIWYIIPLLTLKKNPLLYFFQDEYFKKIYTEDYIKMKEYKQNNLSKEVNLSEYAFSIINTLWDLIQEHDIMWITKTREKTLFSIYNKLNRENKRSIYDNIWVRILFNTENDLYRFIYVFEKYFSFVKKKDYINNPKSNWYKSIHYTYIHPLCKERILVELQVRTIDMEKEIQNNPNLEHFYYTVSQWKWNKKFIEVHNWFEYMKNILYK